MSPRVIRLPVSGGDRKHYARELAIARRAQDDFARQATEAYRIAHRLYCQEWNARQFIGGPAAPSPSVDSAISANFTLLEISCRACGHADKVDLQTLRLPRLEPVPVHDLAEMLFCLPCRNATGRKRRPNLVMLIDTAPSQRGPVSRRAPT